MLLNSVELSKHLTELREHFLPENKITELGQPDNFEQDLDARAYLLLAHSAFEQFFEDTAREFSTSAVSRWLAGSTPTRQQIVTLCCLSSTQGELGKSLALEPPTEDFAGEVKRAERAAVEISPRVKFLAALETGKKNFDTLLEKNHGADLHYLRTIFPSIGVYIDLTPDAQSALSQIANARGTFAHRRTASKRGKFAYKPIAAETAISNVEILLHWCKEFEVRLRNSLRPNYKDIMTRARFELGIELAEAIRRITLMRPAP
jgi:hypothetical protein